MTDEEIEAMRSMPPTMPLLVAWKARAEAAEKEAKRWKDVAKNLASLAETDRDAALFDKAVAGGKVKLAEARAEAAEKRVTELVWQVNNMRTRAEAAEKDAARYREALQEIAIEQYFDNGSFAYHDTLAAKIAHAALEAKP